MRFFILLFEKNIVKRVKYYYLNNSTVEQTIIVSHVQFIGMRDHSNYEHISETEHKHLLFELCCN